MPHTIRHREQSGVWVYFVECTRTRRIKIGSAKSPPERLRGLQCGSPTKLRIVTAAPHHEVGEMELHEEFKRTRLHGEWFKQSPRLRAYIEKVAKRHGPTPWVPRPPKPEPQPSPMPSATDHHDGWSSPRAQEQMRNWFLDCFEDGTLSFKTTPDMVERYQRECDERRANGYARAIPITLPPPI